MVFDPPKTLCFDRDRTLLFIKTRDYVTKLLIGPNKLFINRCAFEMGFDKCLGPETFQGNYTQQLQRKIVKGGSRQGSDYH